MKIEILIYAEVIKFPGDDINDLKKELKNAISSEISTLAGNSITQKHLYSYLKNVEHEIAFECEGEFSWNKKK